MSTFNDLVLILLIAVGVGIVMQFFRQPLIIGHIATGIIVAFSGLISAGGEIESFAHIGIVLLLFLVGLNLSPRTIKETGKVAVYTGLGQVFFTGAVGYLIIRLLGFGHVEGLYLALGLAFSSTIIISKVLSDKGDLQSLYGRIAIGFLIVQDIIAIAVLMALTGLDNPTLFVINLSIVAVAGLILSSFLHKALAYTAKSQELLLLFSIAICIAVAASFELIGLSIEAGALVAGILLSSSRYRHEIAARLKPLRDFFILMFFITLGAQMDFANLGGLLLPAVILSVFVLIGNPLIVLAIMGYLGYPRKIGYQAGLTVAQISEFSLILIALGVGLGHVSQELLSLATIVGVITIAVSTYMILYSDKIYPHIKKKLRIFERKDVRREKHDHKHEVFLFGCNRIGFGILKHFHKIERKFLVVDYNPDVIKRLEKEGVDCRYGDAEDLELLEELTHDKVKFAISTIPKLETNILLLNTLRKANKKAIFAVIAHSTDEAMALYEAGASYVVLPHHMGGDHIGTLIERHGFDAEKYLEEKLKHLDDLKQRK